MTQASIPAANFYEGADRALGMTPTEFRDGGAKAEIYFAVGQCSMGNILAAQTERGVCAILIGDDAEQLVQDLQDRFPKATLIGDARVRPTMGICKGSVGAICRCC